MKQLFYDRGKLSAKRIYGTTMFINALIGKNILCCVAMFHTVTNFQLIDNSLDSLLYGGLMLFAGTIVDKFVKDDGRRDNTSLNQ